MDEPIGAADPARLDALAEVTAAYARYSRTTFGLGEALIGGWLVFAAWMKTSVSATVGEILFVVAPLAWIALLVIARAYYQRHGEVVEQRATLPWGRRLVLFGVYFWSVLAIWEYFQRPHGPGDAALELFVTAVLVATPALAVPLTRGFADASTAAFLVMLAPFVREDPPDVAVYGGALYGVLLIAVGVWQHARYRAIERRLAALRERA